ncbi:holo-[acyl-carrier-protein] synthase [Chamberlinius hualienensis]
MLQPLVHSYKPVVIIHGILDKVHSLDQLSNFIEKYHPGTNVTIVDGYHGWKSILPLWHQVHTFGEVIANISKESRLHVIGYSQGGLVARGILSVLKHNVDTFISLSSPQMGQYGDTSYLRWLFPNHVKDNLYKVFYTRYGQEISIGNYWNDPHQREKYLKFSMYLALLNNETYNPSSEEMKENFLRLNRLVLIGGENDGVITPWQSSHFGFYNKNETVIEMTKQDVFKKDSFGLQTLFHKKKLQIYNVPGVEHLDWHSNETVFKNCILPWLT